MDSTGEGRAAAFPIAVTPEAVHHLERLLARKGQPGDMVRIGVKGGGCSGLEYMVKLDSTRRESDLVLEGEGVTLLCDPKSANFLRGATLTFTGNLIGGGLSFDNPNAARSCGCGTSFTPVSKTKGH